VAGVCRGSPFWIDGTTIEREKPGGRETPISAFIHGNYRIRAAPGAGGRSTRIVVVALFLGPPAHTSKASQ